MCGMRHGRCGCRRHACVHAATAWALGEVWELEKTLVPAAAAASPPACLVPACLPHPARPACLPCTLPACRTRFFSRSRALAPPPPPPPPRFGMCAVYKNFSTSPPKGVNWEGQAPQDVKKRM